MHRGIVVYLLATAVFGLAVSAAPTAMAQNATPMAAAPVTEALPCDLTNEILVLSGMSCQSTCP